jgi:hypothetical protein
MVGFPLRFFLPEAFFLRFRRLGFRFRFIPCGIGVVAVRPCVFGLGIDLGDDVADLFLIPLLGEQFDDPPLDRGRNFDHRFLGLQFDEAVVHIHPVALVDKETVGLAFDPENLFVFDKENGRRLA